MATTAQPLPRDRHAAVGIGSKLVVWGGDCDSAKKIHSRTLEIFDVPSITWEQQQNLHGSDMPKGLYDMAVTTDGKAGYSFGGRTGFNRRSTFYNTLYQVTPSQYSVCKELESTSPSYTAPEKTAGSCIVEFENKLVLHGGWTGRGRNNELHVFDLKSRSWAVQPTTGEKPPPMVDHTFTKIDHHRAVIFGGSTGSRNLSDTYVLDMKTWNWTKMKISGDKPPARSSHATCCIAGPLTGQEHPLLLVIEGSDNEGEALDDLWLLNVDKGVWNKVIPPVPITPRFYHSATVFGIGPSFRVMVLFGGMNSSGVSISETTLLLLESGKVTRVVRPEELGRPNKKLKEQMRRLELPPQAKIPQTVEERAGVSETDSIDTTTAPTNSTPTVVTVDLSDFEIVRFLGKGGQGSVREGIWMKNGGIRVAIKGVTLTSDSAVIPQEIKVWGSLSNHPNVTKLLGVASDNFNAYLITELAVNGSLFGYLHKDKNVPSESQSLAWASDIAHGMKHLHDQGIIHRDLKSANVLLADEWVAKLCDFGSARELTHTITTDQAGTYRWMSPEIMMKATARINKKCDLFSYGMILFELFAHEIPYSDLNNEVDVLKNVTAGKRPEIPTTLPTYLHDLLRSCWEEDPSLRPTFDDFINQIVLT